MRSISFSTLSIAVFLILLAKYGGATPTLGGNSNGPFRPISGPNAPGRRLRAARTLSNIQTRNEIGGALRNSHELHYLDENPYPKSSQFIAKIRLKSKAPSLALEVIEHHLIQISCHDSSISLYFKNKDMLMGAYDELSGTRKFFLITAHEGCNEDGERDAYLVSAITLVEKDFLILCSTTHVEWRDVIHSMTLDFGENNQKYEVRRHATLERRQFGTVSVVTATSSGVTSSIFITGDVSSLTPVAASLVPATSPGAAVLSASSALSSPGAAQSSSSIAASSSASTAVPSTSVVFPNPPASATAAAATVTEIFDKQWLDTAILPPDGSLGVTLKGPLLPAGFSTKCKNCTIAGSIDLIHGSFNIDSGSINGEADKIKDFALNGYAELRLTNFAAHIELESSITTSKTLTKYIAPLPVWDFSPFQIPGIAAVGPQLNPQVSIAIQVEREQDFTYGFDMVIPDGSSVTIDIHNITNSTISGFSDTKITALPFQSHGSDLSLNLITGFHPSLLLGFSFLGNHGTAGAGVFLDLPLVSTSISTVTNVYSNCTPHTSPNSSIVNQIATGISDEVFDALTHVTGSIALDVGLVAEADVSEIYTLGAQVSWNAWSTEWPLPTKCLSFDVGKAEWGSAMATSTASKSSTATAVKKSAAVSCSRVVSAGFEGIMRTMCVAAVMILGTIF